MPGWRRFESPSFTAWLAFYRGAHCKPEQNLPRAQRVRDRDRSRTRPSGPGQGWFVCLFVCSTGPPDARSPRISKGLTSLHLMLVRLTHQLSRLAPPLPSRQLQRPPTGADSPAPLADETHDPQTSTSPPMEAGASLSICPSFHPPVLDISLVWTLARTACLLPLCLVCLITPNPRPGAGACTCPTGCRPAQGGDIWPGRPATTKLWMQAL